MADTAADEGPETDTDPLTQASGGSDQREAGGDQPAKRVRSASRSGSTATSARWARRDEPLGHDPVEPREQSIPVAVRAEQADRLGVQVELRPGHHLGQLLQRAEPTGQGDEPVRQVGHHRLAGMERLDDPQVGDAPVGQLPFDEPAAG